MTLFIWRTISDIPTNLVKGRVFPRNLSTWTNETDMKHKVDLKARIRRWGLIQIHLLLKRELKS